MLYRILRPLDCEKRGVLKPEDGLQKLEWMTEDTIRSLLEVEAISKVSAPPIGVLPGMQKQAQKLEPLGVIDAAQVVEMEDEELAEKLRVKPEQAAEVKEKVKDFLSPEKPKRKSD